MAFPTYEEANLTGLDGLLQYATDIVPIFIPIVLTGVFAIVLFGTYFSRRRLTGRGDFQASFAVASFVTAIIAYTMSLMPNVINTFTLVAVTGIAAIAVMVLWLAKERG